MTKRPADLTRTVLLASASSVVLAASANAYAQENVPDTQSAEDNAEALRDNAAVERETDATGDTIIVTGVRASLERAMDVKRNANGVVDAISAEDIGKFPDTNLAESLQRITGVSIDRVNGEGSGITVRGFGPGFNLITLNGRTLPTAEVGAVGQRGNFASGGSRSFDFSNLASEGVSGLEVYKTGQSILPSGGLGATVNILTRKPIDTDGFDASLQAKAMHDTSVDMGNDVTPELSGLVSWADYENRFGVGLFGSYSKRDSGAPTQQINDWIISRSEDGSIADSYTRGDGSTTIENPPAAGQLYGIAQDSRYDFSDIERERFNGQAVLQFRPVDTLTMTADYTYAQNKTSELRYEQTNWFATPLDQIIFNNDGPVATAVFMQENNNGSKDIGFEQTNRATKDVLQSIGFNAEWEVNDAISFIFDAHHSDAESGGDNPLGHTATFVTFGAPVILQHSVDYRSGYPIQSYTIDDSVRGNGNGVLDVGDLGSQVARANISKNDSEVDEIDLRFLWEADRSKLTAGVNYRNTDVLVTQTTTQQDLGSWGISNPGDIEQIAPGLIENFCLECLYDDLPVGQADNAFRADATELFGPLTDFYAAQGNSVTVSPSRNAVSEEIFSLFAQFEAESEFLGKRARINAGLRYEDTTVDAATDQSVPSAILWTADNDFLVQQSGEIQTVTGEGSYDYILPNADFRLNLTDDLVARASWSKTLGRVPYGNLFASTTAAAPNRPTVLGGQVTGASQNPALLPYESDNLDLAVEWYYDEASYASVTYFDKRVSNFLGTGVVDRNLFGLRDQTSGAPGTRSGDALDIIDDLGIDQSEANLFTLVALIDANNGDVSAARAEFEANLEDGALPQSYVDQILADFDVLPNADDPLLTFAVEQPVNLQTGNINGWEFAIQHFFGDTGFGIQANYTIVDGDVPLDPAADPSENQFALTGLSDTANVVGIYENDKVSVRLAYNWRDEFLLAANQTGDRSGVYVEAYEQLDLSASYNFTDQLAVTFEGINLTGEDQRQYHRVPEQVYFAYELSPRYALGLRYSW